MDFPLLMHVLCYHFLDRLMHVDWEHPATCWRMCLVPSLVLRDTDKFDLLVASRTFSF